MSLKNGDRSRFHRQRSEKLRKRAAIRELRKVQEARALEADLLKNITSAAI